MKKERKERESYIAEEDIREFIGYIRTGFGIYILENTTCDQWKKIENNNDSDNPNKEYFMVTGSQQIFNLIIYYEISFDGNSLEITDEKLNASRIY